MPTKKELEEKIEELKNENYDFEELKENIKFLLEITNGFFLFEKDNHYQYYKRKIELIL